LKNYYGVTHPSEPNYMAAVGGDYFGLNGDPFIAVPENVSTVVDLLEDKKISWGVYEEDMPYSGYQGFSWVNQQTGKNDYVRKHK
jgi:acid phosphatase